jgi:hypothetical protein
MSGHAQWAAIGALLFVAGAGLLIWAWRSRDVGRR